MKEQFKEDEMFFTETELDKARTDLKVCADAWSKFADTGSYPPPAIEPSMVNHPAHYMSETGLEAIDVIEAFTFDLMGIEAFCTGNAIKYLCRWKKKNGLQDLKKAHWYLERLIRHVELLEYENKEND